MCRALLRALYNSAAKRSLPYMRFVAYAGLFTKYGADACGVATGSRQPPRAAKPVEAPDPHIRTGVQLSPSPKAACTAAFLFYPCIKNLYAAARAAETRYSAEHRYLLAHCSCGAKFAVHCEVFTVLARGLVSLNAGALRYPARRLEFIACFC